MPFNVDGQWIPSAQASTGPQKPVKVRLVKRGKSILTVILNLNLPASELTALSSEFKKKLGCGGAVKQSDIELQGDQIAQVTRILREMGIKPS